LKAFLQSLQGRACPDVPLTVLTGGSDLGALTHDERAMREKKVTIAYAAATDSRGWANQVPGTPRHFADFLSAFTEQGFDVSDLDDGGTISTHDALLTAAKAMRLAAKSAPASHDQIPTAVD